MKTSTAIIKLVLRTNKVLSDGSHPIMLRCQFKGRKELSTGYSCLPRFWNEKQECIKKGYPNYAAINAAIGKKKMDAIERRNKFELQGITYTPSMILANEAVFQPSSDDFKALMDKYTSNLSPTTQKVWKSFYNSLSEYKKISLIQEVTLDYVKGYALYLEKKGLEESTVKMTLSKLAALCRYAVEEGIIKESPFKRFNINKKYKLKSSDVYVHHRTIEIMKKMFLDEVIETNGNTWTYKGDSFNQMIDKKSDLFPRYFWLLGLLFAGLAPIDLCQLKLKDFKPKTIDGENYYCLDIKRQKTGIEVHLRIKANTRYSNIMIGTLLMFRKGEYLLPVLDGVENDKLKIYKKVSNWLSNHTKNLREWAFEVNEKIRSDLANKDVPLVPDNITFYTYRHSFSQMYLAKGGNVLDLASLLGRRIDGITAYVKQLSRDSDIVKAVSIID